MSGHSKSDPGCPPRCSTIYIECRPRSLPRVIYPGPCRALPSPIVGIRFPRNGVSTFPSPTLTILLLTDDRTLQSPEQWSAHLQRNPSGHSILSDIRYPDAHWTGPHHSWVYSGFPHFTEQWKRWLDIASGRRFGLWRRLHSHSLCLLRNVLLPLALEDLPPQRMSHPYSLTVLLNLNLPTASLGDRRRPSLSRCPSRIRHHGCLVIQRPSWHPACGQRHPRKDEPNHRRLDFLPCPQQGHGVPHRRHVHDCQHHHGPTKTLSRTAIPADYARPQTSYVYENTAGIPVQLTTAEPLFKRLASWCWLCFICILSHLPPVAIAMHLVRCLIRRCDTTPCCTPTHRYVVAL